MKPKDLLVSLEKSDRTMEHLEDKEPNVYFDSGSQIIYRQGHDFQDANRYQNVQYAQQLGSTTGAFYGGLGSLQGGPIVYR